jgi:hypothetical protein
VPARRPPGRADAGTARRAVADLYHSSGSETQEGRPDHSLRTPILDMRELHPNDFGDNLLGLSLRSCSPAPFPCTPERQNDIS